MLIRLGRGWAKGTIFPLTNPEAAVRSTRVYPESKPRGDNAATPQQSVRLARPEHMRIDKTSPLRTKWGYHDLDQVRFYQQFPLRSGELKERVPAIIAMNAIASGSIARSMIGITRTGDKRRADIPLRPMGEAVEAAHLAAFLPSPRLRISRALFSPSMAAWHADAHGRKRRPLRGSQHCPRGRARSPAAPEVTDVH